MSTASLPDIRSLLGLNPSASELCDYIRALGEMAGLQTLPDAEVKAYSDAVYFNYFKLGLSLLFIPQSGYKPKTGIKRDELRDDALTLDGLDLYNVPKSASEQKSKSAIAAYTTFPLSTLTLTLSAGTVGDQPRPNELQITPSTTGKDFVLALGEPARKGGGAGPSTGSIGIWCEWSKDGLMVEFGGDEARGPQAWERGKDAIWKVVSVFPPKDT
jgi:hypothetical protein